MTTEPEPFNVQELPTLGGIYSHTFQEINERAIALSASYVEGQHLSDFLAMDWRQMEAMILGNVDAVPGMHTVRYDRSRFVLQINDGEPAWADVLIAHGYGPNTDDVRWLLNNLAEGLSLCLAGGFDQPESIWARALSRLRGGSIGLSAIEPGLLELPGIFNAFERSNSSIDSQLRVPIPEELLGDSPGWRDFFSELNARVEAIIGSSLDEARDGDVLDVGPERCWRCEAHEATSTVGLCDGCRIDLKADM